MADISTIQLHMHEKQPQDLKLTMPTTSISPIDNNEYNLTTKRSKLRRYLNDNIGTDLYLELELLLLAFGIGIQDATTFPDYACFASNQTGNTVFLAVGTANITNGTSPPFRNIAFSLAVSTPESVTLHHSHHPIYPILLHQYRSKGKERNPKGLNSFLNQNKN